VSGRFLSALTYRNSEDRPPVWLMRQAGRYLPEYRQLRQKHDFLTLCHEPELAAEVTLQPLKRFELDAAILFSDILVIPEALGMKLRFDEGVGPVFDQPLEEVQLAPSFGDKLDFVKEAIGLVQQQYKGPLLGFSGAPFTLASYMIEGGSSRTFKKTKTWMLKDPEGFHKLLKLLTAQVIAYLKMQLLAGVQAVQLFDSWAHVLSDTHFRAFCLPYLKEIVKEVKPIILFCRGSSIFAPLLAALSPTGISLDWQSNLKEMRQKIPAPIVLQGNLDPDILYASPDVVKQHAQEMVRSMQGDGGYIFNLGHGILPDVPLESVYALVDGVKSA
jgi:uroporphyrinogen decarboxylase